jgi:hypothetical protein
VLPEAIAAVGRDRGAIDSLLPAVEEAIGVSVAASRGARGRALPDRAGDPRSSSTRSQMLESLNRTGSRLLEQG